MRGDVKRFAGGSVKRFQKRLADAKAGAPWEPFPEERIPAVAAALDESDIADLVCELDRLADEKAGTPEWDGDTRDDIARTQHLFARLLCAVPAALQPRVSAALERASRETRDWIALVRGE